MFEDEDHLELCQSCGHECCYGRTAAFGDLMDIMQMELCNYHDGTKCTEYENRPERCQAHFCNKLKEYYADLANSSINTQPLV